MAFALPQSTQVLTLEEITPKTDIYHITGGVNTVSTSPYELSDFRTSNEFSLIPIYRTSGSGYIVSYIAQSDIVVCNTIANKIEIKNKLYSLSEVELDLPEDFIEVHLLLPNVLPTPDGNAEFTERKLRLQTFNFMDTKMQNQEMIEVLGFNEDDNYFTEYLVSRQYIKGYQDSTSQVDWTEYTNYDVLDRRRYGYNQDQQYQLNIESPAIALGLASDNIDDFWTFPHNREMYAISRTGLVAKFNKNVGNWTNTNIFLANFYPPGSNTAGDIVDDNNYNIHTNVFLTYDTLENSGIYEFDGTTFNEIGRINYDISPSEETDYDVEGIVINKSTQSVYTSYGAHSLFAEYHIVEANFSRSQKASYRHSGWNFSEVAVAIGDYNGNQIWSCLAHTAFMRKNNIASDHNAPSRTFSSSSIASPNGSDRTVHYLFSFISGASYLYCSGSGTGWTGTLRDNIVNVNTNERISVSNALSSRTYQTYLRHPDNSEHIFIDWRDGTVVWERIDSLG